MPLPACQREGTSYLPRLNATRCAQHWLDLQRQHHRVSEQVPTVPRNQEAYLQDVSGAPDMNILAFSHVTMVALCRCQGCQCVGTLALRMPLNARPSAGPLRAINMKSSGTPSTHLVDRRCRPQHRILIGQDRGMVRRQGRLRLHCRLLLRLGPITDCSRRCLCNCCIVAVSRSGSTVHGRSHRARIARCMHHKRASSQPSCGVGSVRTASVLRIQDPGHRSNSHARCPLQGPPVLQPRPA